MFYSKADRLMRGIKVHFMGKRSQLLRVSDGRVSFVVGRFILNVHARPRVQIPRDSTQSIKYLTAVGI